jgi:two-component system cell cycle sensor histidine kinase/response regulator CckA
MGEALATSEISPSAREMSAPSRHLWWRGIGVVWTAIGLVFMVAAAAFFFAGGAQSNFESLLLGALAAASFAAAAWASLGLRKRPAIADVVAAAHDGDVEGRAIAEGGVFVHVNAAFRELLGPSEREILSVESISRRLALFDTLGEEAAAAFARIRKAGIPAQAEIPMMAREGAVEWRRISVSPVAMGGRARDPGFVLWRVEDVTARHELDAIRRGEEQHLADLLDRLPVGFFSADADGRVVYANQTLAQWLDLEGTEIRGRPFSDFVVPGEPGEGESRDADADGAVRLRTGSGAGFPAILVQSEHRNANGSFVYTRSVVLRDFMPRDDAIVPERLRWLFDEAPVGIVFLDLQGRVADCNRRFLKLLGLHRDAVVGRAIAERISLEDQADVAAQLSKVVMGTVRAAHLEVRMPAAGHSEVAASVYASRFEDADGEVTGLILHFIDTTEHKHLETQFNQSQKMQAVGQLAGGVAHDFNNLLTAMIGFCDLLLERHGPDDPSFAEIMQIKQNANRATNLVRQLLAFSRQQKLKPVFLDVRASLTELSNLLRRLIGEKIELALEHGADVGLVRVDAGQFDQVIINLAVNARDAMPGGGTLAITTSAEVVEQAVERGPDLMPAGEYSLITVTDTGSGIAKEDIGRIFEPFFSTKEVGEGTGLGLSTVYGIIRQTDGYVFVDSAPSAGTAFSIYLPRAGDGATEAAAPAQVADGLGGEAAPDLTGTGTVLLVEDEDAVRLFGARALRNKGYRVLEANNGEGALDVINGLDEPLDLIISDVVMPGMDGHTLVRFVRHELPAVKIILISGYADDAMTGDIEHDSQIHFLPKPFTLRSLAGKVKEVMAG